MIREYNIYRNGLISKSGEVADVYVKAHLPASILYVSDNFWLERSEYIIIDVQMEHMLQ